MGVLPDDTDGLSMPEIRVAHTMALLGLSADLSFPKMCFNPPGRQASRLGNRPEYDADVKASCLVCTFDCMCLVMTIILGYS